MSCAYVDPSCNLAWYFDPTNSNVYFELSFQAPDSPTWYGIGFNTKPDMVIVNIIFTLHLLSNNFKDWNIRHYDS